MEPNIDRDLKIVELTQEQKDKVLERLMSVQGDFDEYIELGEDITIEAQGYLYVDGYREEDYLNGTGGFVETSRSADVILTAFVGEKQEVFDVQGDFSTECYQILQAA